MSERILVIRLSALGDVVLATPAARALRAHFPEARIDWLVDAAYLPILAHNPHLSNVVPYDRRAGHAGAAGLLRLRAQLRSQKYDLVIDLQAKPKTVALARALGAQRVVTLQKRSRGEALRALIGLDRPNVRLHAIEMYLEALGVLGVKPQGFQLECSVTERGRTQAERFFPAAASVVGLSPGARWATKRWEPARFAEVGNALARAGHRVLLLGGPGDRAELEAVRAGLEEPALDTAELGVEGLIAAVSRCKLVVAGDSGPVHLADALGVPTVALYGPTAPRRWAPRDPRHRIIHKDLVCSPCSNHGSKRCPLGSLQCMREIASSEVAEAALGVLAAPAREARAP
ncbi:MAG: glycosyltransferase family 9 protein [Deltaproteobacteria bacterium]|nr:glycosyltransferase family 9 protein [Deltaproteobacteria bacterium]